MKSKIFIGRSDECDQIKHVIRRDGNNSEKLIIQSIEGPGGIGKTSLFDEVFAKTSVSDKNYLILKIEGRKNVDSSLVEGISWMLKTAQSSKVSIKPTDYFFPSTQNVLNLINDIHSAAINEFEKYAKDNNESKQFAKYLNISLELGESLNKALPKSSKYIDFVELKNLKEAAEKHLAEIASLRISKMSVFNKIGLFRRSKAIKNQIKDNARGVLAEKLILDLTLMLQGHWKNRKTIKEIRGIVKNKVEGIDRLLLVIDDYEHMKKSLEIFLLSHFFPLLKNANFESTIIIIGRDKLTLEIDWDQHFGAQLQPAIEVTPLSKKEVDELLEAYDVNNVEEKKRAWRDTEGYPYLVHLLAEELKSGGRTAMSLKQFYDRTTRWMNEIETQWLENALFLKEVNQESFGYMLGDSMEGKVAFEWFQNEGSVRHSSRATQDTPPCYHVREFIRSRLVEYIKICDPEKYRKLKQKADSFFNKNTNN